jgi:thiol-disulfide isomerase/thioredoxin
MGGTCSALARRPRGLLLALPLLALGAGRATAGDLLDLQVHRGDAAPVSLRALLDGAPAIVSLWATYCAPCRAEVPALQAALRRWRPRGVRVVAVALDFDAPARVARAAHEWGMDYDVLWLAGDQRAAASALVPAGVPATFLVGPGGVTRHDRFLGADDLDALIARVLGPEPSAAGARGP